MFKAIKGTAVNSSYMNEHAVCMSTCTLAIMSVVESLASNAAIRISRLKVSSDVDESDVGFSSDQRKTGV